MSSVKCIGCGLINGQEESSCKRCGTRLTSNGIHDKQPLPRSPWRTENPLWAGSVKVLVIAAAACLLLALFRQTLGSGLSSPLGMILKVIGVGVAFVGGLSLLIAAFRISVLWGIASLFIPFVSLVFVIVHWPNAKRPFAINALGLIIMFAGFFLAEGTSLSTP
jgi:hypothetical protein